MTKKEQTNTNIDLDKIEIGSDGKINVKDIKTKAAIKKLQKNNQDTTPDDLELCVSGCGDPDTFLASCQMA